MHLDSLIELTKISIEQNDSLEFNKIMNLMLKIDEDLAKSYIEKNSL